VILIDTSAWVDYLRGTGSAATVEVRRLLSTESDRVVEPIAMELLRTVVSIDNHHRAGGLPIRHGAAIVHCDAYFEAIAAITRVDARSLR